MNRYEFTDGADALLLVDVAPSPDESAVRTARWAEAMRRLSGITDPFARQILALHRDCGSGTGVCDFGLGHRPMAERVTWGCETVALIAHQFGVTYPTGRVH